MNQSIWNRNQYQTPTPWAKNDVQEISNENSPQIQIQTQLSKIPRYWDTASEGEKVWNYVQQQEGNVKPQSQNYLNYMFSLGKGLGNIYANYQTIAPIKMSDKYKHAVINCEAAQQGKGGYDIAKWVSWGKELTDVLTDKNTKDSSQSDNYANKIGRLLGTKYPNDNCRIIVQKYIDK